MSTKIFFLRHGEVYNPQNILYGRLPNFGLSENGAVQIKASADFFQKQNLAVIYASPMQRTQESAKIIGDATKVKILTSDLLNEIDIIHQGISLKKYHDQIQRHLYEKKYLDKGQESIEEITRRMDTFVRTAKKEHENQNILAVSHGDPIMILRSYHLGIRFTYQYKKKNYLQTGKWLTLEIYKGVYYWI